MPRRLLWVDAVWFMFWAIVVTHAAIRSARNGDDWAASLFAVGALIGGLRTYATIERAKGKP